MVLKKHINAVGKYLQLITLGHTTVKEMVRKEVVRVSTLLETIIKALVILELLAKLILALITM